MRIEGGRTARPAWDPTGRLVVAGFPARLWDTGDGERPVALGLLPSVALSGGSAFAFSSDGTEMGTGLSPVVWDVRDPADPVRRTTDVALQEPAELALYQPDGSLLVLGTSFGSLSLWDAGAEPARHVDALLGSRSGTQAAAFVGPDLLVTAAEDGGALVWDVRSGGPEVVSRLTGRVDSVAALGDGRTLLVGGSAGDVSLWDLSDPGAPKLLVQRSAHVGPVTGVAGQPDGALVATAGEDGIRLWTRTDGRIILMATLRAGQPFDAPALAFSPAGNFLAASSIGGTEIWDVDVDALLGQLCWESEDITAEQWEQYLPDFEYEPPCDAPASGRRGTQP
jgi:WD40 repeat protein